MPYSKDNTAKSLAAILIILATVTLVAGGFFLWAYSTVATQKASAESGVAASVEEPSPKD